MHDVRLLERHDGITTGMRRAVVLERHRVGPDRLAPRRRECRIGHDDVLRGRARPGRCRLRCRVALQLGHIDLREDLLHGRSEDGIAAGMVAVVMRVDQVVDDLAPVALLDAVEADLRGRRHLGVDDSHAVFRDVVADGAALSGEEPHRAANGGEGGLGRRWWRLTLRGLRGAGKHLTEVERRGGKRQRRGGQELTTIQRHRRALLAWG